MKITCQVLGHRRSRERVGHVGTGVYKSVCRGCGAPMIRIGPKQWLLLQDRAGVTATSVERLASHYESVAFEGASGKMAAIARHKAERCRIIAAQMRKAESSSASSAFDPLLAFR